jgi:hypothetical protein
LRKTKVRIKRFLKQVEGSGLKIYQVFASQFPILVKWVFRLVSISAIVLSAIMIVLQQYWIEPLGNMSPFSLGSAALVYLLSEKSLTDAKITWFDAIILSILYCNVFLQSYELIYHFSYPVYLNYFRPPFLSGEALRYLILGTLPLLPIFMLRRYLSFKRISLAMLVVFASIWIVWIMYGYPQYFSTDYFYPRILKTDDPFTVSLMLNFGSKPILALFFVTLLNTDSIDPFGMRLRDIRGRLFSSRAD